MIKLLLLIVLMIFTFASDIHACTILTVKTIDNLELNTTYYWKVAAHPKGNDHFMSESFISSFIVDSKSN